jgi:hypothetical protein
MPLGISFRPLRPRRPSSVAPLCLDRQRRARSGVRLAFESLESRCLLSGSGFRPTSEIGNNIADRTEQTAGMDLLRMAAAGYADGISTPSMANRNVNPTIATEFSTLPFRFGQSLLSGGIDCQPECDAIVMRGGVEYRFATWMPADESALVKAQMVQAAFKFAEAGDVVTIEPGIYDFGRGGPYLLPPCLVRGSGPGVTILQSQKLIDGETATPTTAAIAVGPSFALQDGTVLEDMSLITTPWNIYEDGGCVGFLPTTSNAHAIVRRCQIQANDWAVYNWSPGNTLLLADSTVTSGRVCIAAEDSGDGQNFYIVRCKLIGDASLSSSIGATSNQTNGGVFGVVARGGKVQLIDCDISLKGETPTWPSFTPRVCGVTDVGGDNASPAGVDEIMLWNLRCNIDPNGCDPTQCFDLDLKYPYVQAQLRATPGWGSAADGTLSKSWSWPSTLTNVDNGDGTGAIATISGSSTGSLNTVYTHLDGMTSWMSSGFCTGDGTLELSISPVLQPLTATVAAPRILASRRSRVSLSSDSLKDRQLPKTLRQPVEPQPLFRPALYQTLNGDGRGLAFDDSPESGGEAV